MLIRRFQPLAALAVTATLLAACSGAPSGGGLAPGLTAQINAPGAQMDRQAALDIVNHYRATRGVAPLAGDPALDAKAQQLAQSYASTGTPPSKPADIAEMRLSAGYTTFAETFSGWRNRPEDANALAFAGASRVGFAAAYDGNSAYGAHWVMVLGQ